MMDKKGIIGEGVIEMYRIFLVSFIALVILGMSGLFYPHHIDVRDVEASIMARNIVNCIVSEEKLIVEQISEVDLLEYCGYIEYSDIFYLKLIISDEDSEENILDIDSGNSGAEFVSRVYDNAEVVNAEGFRYIPGYFSGKYPVILENGNIVNLNLEVIVVNEE